MYLHLGNDQVISGEQVIVIVNLEEAAAGQYDNILETARREQRLKDVSKNGKKKAMVVCDERIYLSPISSSTLYKRAINYHRED